MAESHHTKNISLIFIRELLRSQDILAASGADNGRTRYSLLLEVVCGA